MQPTVRRQWRPNWPCSITAALQQHQRGAGDPTQHLGEREAWRAMRTPDGPATVRLVGEGDRIVCEGWGAGAAWAIEQVPALLGANDDLSGFPPGHPVLTRLHRRFSHWRFSSSGLVYESLLPAIIEQRVTSQEAFAGFRKLVRKFGAPAPGPGADLGLMLQPAPADIVQIPSWAWLKLHVDPARSKIAVATAGRAASLERQAGLSVEALDRALRSFPGVGVWTSAEVRQRVVGDADAVSFGDYHVATNVGFALTGQPATDAEMADLLEPWRPHRGRVAALVALARIAPARRGPRMAPRTHLPR